MQDVIMITWSALVSIISMEQMRAATRSAVYSLHKNICSWQHQYGSAESSNKISCLHPTNKDQLLAASVWISWEQHQDQLFTPYQQGLALGSSVNMEQLRAATTNISCLPRERQWMALRFEDKSYCLHPAPTHTHAHAHNQEEWLKILPAMPGCLAVQHC